MMSDETVLVKIDVPTNGDDWHGMTLEKLWAEKTGDYTFILKNIPLYAYGISYEDEVFCCKDNGGSFTFDSVVHKGGHSNYRVLLKGNKSAADFLSRWPEIEKLGCAYESSRDPEDVFGIDVPPSTDVNLVYELLMEGERSQIWLVDEGNFEHGPVGT